MKVLKMLGVLVTGVGMATLLTATAYANHAQITATLNCTSDTKVCFDVTATTSDFPPTGRHITVTLMGHKKGDADAKHFVKIGDSKDVPLAQKPDTKKFQLCFDVPQGVNITDFDQLELVIQPDNAADFDVNGHSSATIGPFANNCPQPSPSPSPSASASASPSASPSMSPSASPSAATTVVLANTGGFDYRFPLIGLIVIVVGAVLFVVSASRGRSTSER